MAPGKSDGVPLPFKYALTCVAAAVAETGEENQVPTRALGIAVHMADDGTKACRYVNRCV